MIPPRLLAPLLGMMLGFGAATAQAADEAKLRTAITSGLGYLAREGDAWVAKEKCLSCHHMPMILWSHAEAARRGFPVDPKKMEGWRQWCATYADAKGGPEALTLLLLTPMPAGHTPPETLQTAALLKNLLATQHADGSWRAKGRLGMNQQRKADESHEYVTTLALQALPPPDAKDEKSNQARARALLWLQKRPPAQTTETLLNRALLARDVDEPDREATLLKNLFDLQHADGGWAWSVTETQSDAYTTGQVLFALRDLKAKTSAQVKKRAQAWLLAAQREDGAWPVNSALISNQGPDHLKITSEMYTTWATNWAVLALLQDLPLAGAK